MEGETVLRANRQKQKLKQTKSTVCVFVDFFCLFLVWNHSKAGEILKAHHRAKYHFTLQAEISAACEGSNKIRMILLLQGHHREKLLLESPETNGMSFIGFSCSLLYVHSSAHTAGQVVDHFFPQTA